MTAAAGMLLVEEIMPIITATVPRVARPVGAEDAQELVQDTLASAARMVESAEKAGKPLYPQSIAFYAIQRTKSDRRAMSAGRADAMCPGAQLDGDVAIDSMDQEFEDDAGGETVCLHDVLAAQQEDPSQQAARELDWSELLARLDDREVDVLVLTARSGRLEQLAAQHGISVPRVCQIRQEVGRRVRQEWGDTALQDATMEAKWLRNDLRTGREKVACRHERWRAGAM